MYKAANKKTGQEVVESTPHQNVAAREKGRRFIPLTNVLTLDSGWELMVGLPGYTKKEVSISITNNKLTIFGNKELNPQIFTRREWSNEWFERSFSLAEVVDLDQISAEMTQGILRIRIPKKADVVKKIKIQ